MSFTTLDVQNPKAWTLFITPASFILVLGVYFMSITVYRLRFSPIAKFPGPKIAAISGWYEAYYDIVKRGKYLYEIEKMHAIYGPVVRINPWELNIKDPEFYTELFVAANTRRTEKWASSFAGLGFDDTHIATVSHELHRKRRKPLAPFFTRRSLESVEVKIAEKAVILDKSLQRFRGLDTAVHLEHAFSAFAGDIICQICCDHPSDLLNDPAFATYWIIVKLPEQVLVKLSPAIAHLQMLEMIARSGIDDAKHAKVEAPLSETESTPTLFQFMVSSDMPPAEKTMDRLTQEAMLLFGAGSFTVASTMVTISYHLLANHSARTKLQEEIGNTMSEYPHRIPHRVELEKIPYLTAVVKEGLRIGSVISRRQTRMFPDEDVKYQGWTIPRNTPMGMSAYFMHMDPDIFPEPHKFIPERWLGEYNPLMDRNFVPFAKGSRGCLGEK
ncbi:Cytochrome P450 monooxygenase [Lachnellula subtilissima]|uniref:Cytochrome P450 monooxygenase n=1 Tax=Lachnellula subtilissima TaxID=602034 RepID=A0A8H8UGA3_9HELO|nr:Cytochrome P450 monooxygenase [Lachnellula subtilissima]